MNIGIDLKSRRKDWWREKALSEVTWNHLILAMVILAIVIACASLDGNRVFGLR